VPNDAANAGGGASRAGVVTVVPVISNVGRVHPLQVLLSEDETGMPRDSKAQAEQVRWVDVERIGPVLGAVRGRTPAALEEALRLHLAL
jgi:mRNA interferase MazF